MNPCLPRTFLKYWDRAQAAFLVGMLQYLYQCYVPRRGPASWQFFEKVQYGEIVGWSAAVGHNLSFHLELIDIKPYGEVSLGKSLRTRHLVYTDTSTQASQGGPDSLRLCWIIWRVASHSGKGLACDVLKVWRGIAPLLCYYFRSHEMRQGSVLHMIDNMSVLCSLVLGASHAADLSELLYATVAI